MAKAISIHIGLNEVDKTHYLDVQDQGFTDLKSCVNDAKAMAKVAGVNFTTPIAETGEVNKTLINNEATTDNVLKYLELCAAGAGKLEQGDTLLVTFAGHGGQVADSNADTEGDRFDETWCLWNRQLLDDELFEAWTKFQPGVRIVVISDSCHSGTVIGTQGFDLTDKLMALRLRKFSVNNFERKTLNLKGFEFAVPNENKWQTEDKVILEEVIGGNFRATDEWLRENEIIEPRVRKLPESLLKKIRSNFREGGVNKYDQIQLDVRSRVTLEAIKRNKKDFRDLIEANVILIAACQDWQVTNDGENEQDNGVFTKAFLKVLEMGNYTNYLEFHREIWSELKSTQSPNYYKIGTPNPEFELEKPFLL